ncbi:hypothetical protein C7M84_025497 [Penaeus vannamei]|uniref:Uncharacterized protein n=1 Tax=Penaeus vannamei TaxID=6689 RepID=A0A3R7MGS4_PENVA|nr:hypothetical protein C7M84_025497 [Penaeus vannamei]
MLGRAVDLPQLAGSADELRASLTSLTRFGLEKIEFSCLTPLFLPHFSGRGWRPKNGHTAIVTAKLGTHVVTTDPVALTSDPQFYTELSWELESQIIRRLKVDHVPIRVECHSISKRGKQECLGYIIMPLATAVLGVESDPNWHKLLGGPSVPHKKPPSIRLALCLRNTKVRLSF